MGSEGWQEAVLTDFYDIRSGLSKPAKDFGSGYPFLSFKDVFYNYFIPDKLEQLVQSNEKERSGCSVQRGDVFLTRTSETMNELGMSSVALKSYENATFNGFCKRLRPKENCPLLPEYIGYYLRSPKFRSEMLAFSTMSTRASLNNEMIGRLKVIVPPLDEQKTIADVLKTLDDKIQLNRQTNQTLEQIAQALFKSWFVDFDPVIDNALEAGNAIPEELHERAERRKAQIAKPDHQPLPDDIRKMFPSEFEFAEEMGWVPKGWEAKSIHDMVDTISDTYKLKEVDEVIFLNTGDIEDGKFLHNDYCSTDGLPGQAKKSIAKGDILYSEIRPKNKRYAFVDFDAEDYVVSTKLMVLRAKTDINPLLPYFILTQDKTINELQHVAEHRSGTFPQITFKELDKIVAILPQESVLLTLFLEQYLAPIFTKKRASIDQNEQLEKLRDTLLPKLISGELEIPVLECAERAE